MCGIAGFSRAHDVDADASMLVRLLIAGLAERGEDACGYGWRDRNGSIRIVKRSMTPLQFLSEVSVEVPPTAVDVIVHVRDHTKGRPSIDGNNHPIRHGAIVGVHNGVIQNDEELFEQQGRQRAMAGTSVDSEAIFMLLDAMPTYDECFPLLRGSYSVAFLDERAPDGGIHVVRGRGRPLIHGSAPGLALFASTLDALEFVGTAIGQEIRTRSQRKGTAVVMRDGHIGQWRPIQVSPFRERPTLAYDPQHDTAIRARRLVEAQLAQRQESA
jgi:glucosamine 6-phosphate synthetase-like amidotransferase/phosphosugar isomerase protein